MQNHPHKPGHGFPVERICKCGHDSTSHLSYKVSVNRSCVKLRCNCQGFYPANKPYEEIDREKELINLLQFPYNLRSAYMKDRIKALYKFLLGES